MQISTFVSPTKHNITDKLNTWDVDKAIVLSEKGTYKLVTTRKGVVQHTFTERVPGQRTRYIIWSQQGNRVQRREYQRVWTANRDARGRKVWRTTCFVDYYPVGKMPTAQELMDLGVL